MSSSAFDFEALLREALAPVEPPADMALRFEATLINLTELAQEELDTWELSAMRDPRNWARPAAAVVIGAGAGIALVLLRVRNRHRARKQQSGEPGRADRAHAGGHRRRGAADPAPPLNRARGRESPDPAATRALIASAAHGRLLSPSLARDRGLVLILRAADLPRLHDADLGGDALPGVLARPHEGQDDPQRGPRTPLVTQDPDRDQRDRVPGRDGHRRAAGRRRLGNGWVVVHGVLYGPNISIAATSTGAWSPPGFLHDGLVSHPRSTCSRSTSSGNALEPAIGRLNFAAIYFASLLAGSFGALLFQPQIPTVGASTAIFGIFGALIVVAHARGISLWQSGLAPMLLINLVFSVTYAGISLGGHLGGLIGGLITGWAVVELGERRRQPPLGVAAACSWPWSAWPAAIAVAGQTGIAPNGVTL